MRLKRPTEKANKKRIIENLLEFEGDGDMIPLITYRMGSGELTKNNLAIPGSNIILSLRHHFNEVRSKGPRPIGHDHFEALIKKYKKLKPKPKTKEKQRGEGIRKPMAQKKWLSYR